MLVTLILAAFSCGRSTGNTGLGPTAADTPLTEPQIVGVLSSLNAGEVRVGQLAMQRAVDPFVRDYATRMVSEHTAAEQAVQQLGIAAEPSDLSADLDEASAEVSVELAAAPSNDRTGSGNTDTGGGAGPGGGTFGVCGTDASTGAPMGTNTTAFDCTYVSSEVYMHSTALRVIDQILLPQAVTPALVTLLETQRQSEAAHLQDARYLAGTQGTGSTDGGTGDTGSTGDTGVTGTFRY